MTVQKRLERMLVSKGMLEIQAKEIVELSKPDLHELVDDYKITFNANEYSYPDVIYNVLFMAIKPTALKWIELHKPEAWYKSIFQT